MENLFGYINAKPFLKWAGGKSQLINDIKNQLPKEIISRDFTYIEPFVGSGAVLFWLLNNFPHMKKAVINDINPDLIGTYRTIAQNLNELISVLRILQNEYHSLEGEKEKKRAYYNDKRALFNERKQTQVVHSALFIFLNKTCFNGLYRVNRKNEYNVPMGSYHKPLICDEKNLLAVSEALQKVEILCGDFEQTLDFAQENTLFYFDPPYKPINETSSFNSYSHEAFQDEEQIRLRDFCRKLATLKHSWILSNSDLKNTDAENNFFDDLYADFTIERVLAKRSINSNSKKRGQLTELLITNI